jgi:hypothetical protein
MISSKNKRPCVNRWLAANIPTGSVYSIAKSSEINGP